MTDPLRSPGTRPTQALEIASRPPPLLAPFVQILLGCLERRASGSLSVASPSRGRLWVRIEGGFPTAVAGDGVQETVQATLLPLCSQQQGGFSFHEGEDRIANLSSWLRGAVDPHALLAEAFRHPARTQLVNRHVSLSDARTLMVARGVNLARYRFTDEERRVADRLLARPSSVPALSAQPDLSSRAVRRVVYVLEMTGALSELKGRDESGRRAIRPPELDGAPGTPPDAYITHERPVQSRSSAPPAPVTPTPSTPMPAGRTRNRTLPFGAVAPEVAPPTSEPASAPPPPARQAWAADSGRPQLGGRSTSFIRPRSPAGGYAISMPPHGAEAARSRLPSAPPPPADMAASHRARWREVVDRYGRLGREDHFLALGVPRNAGDARIASAFRSETSRYEPRFLPPELSAVRPYAEAIVEALKLAHDAIREPERRAAYLRRLSR